MRPALAIARAGVNRRNDRCITVTPALPTRAAGKEGAMFDAILVEFTDPRSDEPLAASSLPWQVVALLLSQRPRPLPPFSTPMCSARL